MAYGLDRLRIRRYDGAARVSCPDGLDLYLHVPTEEPEALWLIVGIIVGGCVGVVATMFWALVWRRL